MHDHGRAARRASLARLAPVVLVLAGLTAGCTGSDDPEPEPVPTDVALSEIDLSGVVAARTAFCDALDPESVAVVLDGEPERTDEYESGQRVELAAGLRDVAHEYSCFFERGSRTARAWLFAQPTTQRQARQLIEERTRDDRCEAAGELAFGDPGLVQSCAQGERRRVTAVGLFGDGWLTCQTTAPARGRDAVEDAELLELTQRWCAEVARTTAAPS